MRPSAPRHALHRCLPQLKNYYPSTHRPRPTPDRPLCFDAIRSQVSKPTTTFRLEAPSDSAGTTSPFTFTVATSNDTFAALWRSAVLSDWCGTVTETGRDAAPTEVSLTLCGAEVCTYPPGVLQVTHPLLKLKRALANDSVPRRLEIRGIQPDEYVPVNSCGDFRCLSFPGGSAHQWVLESKYGRQRRGEYCAIKQTKALANRFFLDHRAALRAPSFVASSDGRAWVYLNFPPEGTESALIAANMRIDWADPRHHLSEAYWALWSSMATFFRLAVVAQALLAASPWLGPVRLLRPPSDEAAGPLDPDAFSVYCTAVCTPKGEAVLIIGPRGSGRRTLAHHILACCPSAQLVTSEIGVLALAQKSHETVVEVTGNPLFHSVRVGTAIGSLFPNNCIEQTITPQLAQSYLETNSEHALWEIAREVPVNITACYGKDRVWGMQPCPVKSIIFLNWDTARSKLTNDPALRTLVRADPPADRRWEVLERVLFNHVALPEQRFVRQKDAGEVPGALPLERAAVAHALVGNSLKREGTAGAGEDMRVRAPVWYEVGGEVNFERAVKFCVREVLGESYVSPV